MQSILIGFFDAIGYFINILLPNFAGDGLNGASESIQTVVTFIAGADYFFPVETLFYITGLVVSYHLFMMGLWLFNWVVKLLRG